MYLHDCDGYSLYYHYNFTWDEAVSIFVTYCMTYVCLKFLDIHMDT